MVDYNKALDKSGLSYAKSASLLYDLAGAPNLKALLNKLDSNPKISESVKDEIVVSLGKKYSSDSDIIKKLESDLKADPSLATKLEQNTVNNPNGFMKALLPAYSGGNLAQAITIAAPPVAAQSAPKESATIANNSPKKSVEMQPSTSKTASSPTPTKDAVKPVRAVVEEVSQAPLMAAKPLELAANTPANNTLFKSVFGKFADASDADISARVDSGLVQSVLENLSTDAVEKFGVDAATANGFKQRVNQDPQLLNDITNNFKNNPGFVRELAKASQDTGEEMSESKRNAARTMITPLLANPELLAKDAKAKELERNLQMANSKSPFMDMFKNLFGGMGGGGLGAMFAGIFDKIKDLVAGFFGDNQVFSMRKSPNSMIPSVMVNLDAIDKNRAQARLDSQHNARDMTAFTMGKPGFVITEKEGPGKTVIQEKVWNGMDIKTADGKTMKVHPSVGILQAQQMPGNGDGHYRVPVITKLDDKGNAADLKFVMMAKPDFEAYKKETEKLAKAAGDNRPLETIDYPAERFAQEQAKYGRNITTIDPANGTVRQPVSAIPGVVLPPAQRNQNAANEMGRDRDYELQG